MNIKITPRKLLIWLLYLIAILLFANTMGIIFRLYFNHDIRYVNALIHLFDFNAEKNIPTFYSSLAIIFSSALLFLISSTHKKNNSSYISWLGLAVIFLFLSIDEISSIHERIGIVLKESFNTSGLLYYAWVIPYGSALIAFAITYFKFLINLPKNIMLLFLASGAIFITGALGFELLEGRQDDLYGTNNLTYYILYTCEEFLEMIGIAIFIYTLLTYIITQFKPLSITIVKDKRDFR